MLSSLVQRYKTLRRQQYLNRLGGYQYSYAFIGAGQHSLHHLYPVLRQLNIPLKYICTRTKATAQKVANSFPDCTPTTSIDRILEDESVKGVFICTQPGLHQELISRALKAGKAVFVDKPPALSGEGLAQLIEVNSQQPCVVGLQRRFSTVAQLLNRQKLGNAVYNYQYRTGGYPEGNAVYELFIHPVDFAVHVFGPAEIKAILSSSSGRQLTNWTIQLQHQKGAVGTLQLSTSGSWSEIAETMEINTEKEILEVRYPFHMEGTEKPASIAGIPLDKILRGPTVKKIYLDNRGTVPSLANNSLVMQGFYGEIDHFIKLVEKGAVAKEGSLESLKSTYDILDRLNAAGVH